MWLELTERCHGKVKSVINLASNEMNFDANKDIEFWIITNILLYIWTLTFCDWSDERLD